jgi:hypothetical protein
MAEAARDRDEEAVRNPGAREKMLRGAKQRFTTDAWHPACHNAATNEPRPHIITITMRITTIITIITNPTTRTANRTLSTLFAFHQTRCQIRVWSHIRRTITIITMGRTRIKLIRRITITTILLVLYQRSESQRPLSTASS